MENGDEPRKPGPSVEAHKRDRRRSALSIREPPGEWEAVSAVLFAEAKDSQVRTRDAVTGLGYLLGVCVIWVLVAFMSVPHPSLHYVGACLLAAASIAGIAWLTKRHKKVYREVERRIERIQRAADLSEALP